VNRARTESGRSLLPRGRQPGSPARTRRQPKPWVRRLGRRRRRIVRAIIRLSSWRSPADADRPAILLAPSAPLNARRIAPPVVAVAKRDSTTTVATFWRTATATGFQLYAGRDQAVARKVEAAAKGGLTCRSIFLMRLLNTRCASATSPHAGSLRTLRQVETGRIPRRLGSPLIRDTAKMSRSKEGHAEPQPNRQIRQNRERQSIFHSRLPLLSWMRLSTAGSMRTITLRYSTAPMTVDT